MNYLKPVIIIIIFCYHYAMTNLEIIVFQWSDMLSDYARIYIGPFSFKLVNIFFITDNKNVNIFVSHTKVLQ